MVGNSNSSRNKNSLIDWRYSKDDLLHKVFFTCNCYCGRYQNQYIIINDCNHENCLRRRLYNGLEKNDIKNTKSKILEIWQPYVMLVKSYIDIKIIMIYEFVEFVGLILFFKLLMRVIIMKILIQVSKKMI